MEEYGLYVGSSTVFGGMKTIYSSFLRPLYEAMTGSSRDSQHVHVDEKCSFLAQMRRSGRARRVNRRPVGLRYTL